MSAFVGLDFHEADRWAQRRFDLLDRDVATLLGLRRASPNGDEWPTRARALSLVRG
jgi:hypothetical protein